jgi:phenylalanyl-tRNA synthetase beta chain
MNISYRWLQELVAGLQLTPLEVADRLAMLGAPVDEVLDLGGPLRDIIVARVEEAGRHPNADRLSLCTVNAGGEALQVVCGAPNVRAGGYYPFAPVGASLPGGLSIRKAKIRGVESQGMLCSPRELGLGRDHEGIMELRGEFEPGRSFIAALGYDDARLAVDITPNRPDLLSHLGVAREIAAAVGLEARLHALPGAAALPELKQHGDGSARSDAADVTVAIEDVDLCPRYYGLVIRGVQVGPSPEWLAARMRAIGLRPISNVVDATNFVLHELGQPLHAFDLQRLGRDVVVRRARAGERITTLDGVDRALGAGMLVIADAQRPVAIAGVMGGADTEVQDDTRDLLLECALFDPRSVRATRRALGLSTDASYRFERGVDPDGTLRAVQRAAELIVAVAGGRVEADVAAAGPGMAPGAPIRLRLRRVEQVLGEAFTAEAAAGLLRPLGFTVEAGADTLTVGVPGHRRYDVHGEEDLIEEIARRHGYDAFADELRPFRPSSVPSHPLFRTEDRLRTLLVGRGFLEAHTAAFGPEPDGDVALLLPLAATESRLRRALLPALVRRVEYNFARGARSVRLFELGTVFAPGNAEGGSRGSVAGGREGGGGNAGGGGGTAGGGGGTAGEGGNAGGSGNAGGGGNAGSEPVLPREATRLGVIFTGPRRPPHWGEAEVAFDVWDLKALAAELSAVLGMKLDGGAADPLMEGSLSFRLLSCDDDTARGVAGRIRADRVDAPAWAGEVWGIEVELPTAAVQRAVRFRELPAFPGIERDLALVMPDSLLAEQVAGVIRGAAGPLLEVVEPFDVYSGSGVPEGSRSVAYRLRFRAADRTLTDAEVDESVRRILGRLNEETGVRQRA